ncbi:hypothetical protein [Streptomyces rochei]|uniref:hypothetical protein n=1 Tax=Streptomyces rochei TaxID=1928 RepID=UPI0036FD7543
MSHHRPRARRIITRVQAAVVLAGLTALTILALAASVGAVRSAPAPQRPAPVSTVDDDAIATAYNDGWTEGQDDLMATDCANQVHIAAKDEDPLAAAYNKGWVEGQDHLVQSGACEPENMHAGAVAAPLECEHNDAPNDVFRLCLTVAERPGGADAIAALPQEPGTPQWTNALRALDNRLRNAA